jgi:hypothetical protein
MARLHVTGGTLVVEGAGPVDPGFGGGIGSGHPDNSLPPGFPPIGSTLPEPPPGVWPPLTPSAPIQPAHPIAGVPVPPGTIWPSPGHPSHPIAPGRPGHPDQGLPVGPGHPDAGLPVAPGHPDAGLPVAPGHPDQGLPSKTFWVVAGIPGVGWRYVAVDPSLTVGHPLPPTPAPKG